MITYNDLYEALRKERYSEQLQQLPKNFVEDCLAYFKDKREFSTKEEDLFSDLTAKNKKKLENALALFKELLLRRRKKLLSLAFVASETGISKRDFDNMFDFEREMFESIVKSMEKADRDLNSLTVGIKEEHLFKIVRFLEDVPEFLDLNGESIGPFEKGEIANLPKEIVDILSNDKKTEVIDEDN
jgi:DNA replication initiation complex subunit (GINS family)